MKRSVYDKQFKMAAVKLAQETDNSVVETAKELDIRGSSLRRWINEYDEYGESAFPEHGNALFNSTYEVKKLQKQVEELEMENELLKNSRPSPRKRMCEIPIFEGTSKRVQHSEGLQDTKNLTIRIL